MVKKENASTSLMLAKANTEKAALTGTAISKIDFNTETGGRQPGLVEAILIHEGARGAANAIRTDRLVKLAGLGDKRTLQSVIEDERGRDALIISQSPRRLEAPEMAKNRTKPRPGVVFRFDWMPTLKKMSSEAKSRFLIKQAFYNSAC